jgi:crooked neck
MPKVVKKRRRAADSTDDNIIWEEYFDYIFPDDEVQSRSLKFLQMAQAWQSKVKYKMDFIIYCLKYLL